MGDFKKAMLSKNRIGYLFKQNIINTGNVKHGIVVGLQSRAKSGDPSN